MPPPFRLARPLSMLFTSRATSELELGYPYAAGEEGICTLKHECPVRWTPPWHPSCMIRQKKRGEGCGALVREQRPQRSTTMGQGNEYIDEIDLRQYIEVLWLGKWIILTVTLCAMLSAGLVSFLLLGPVYESSTVLTVSFPEEVQASLGDPVIAGIIGGTPQAHIRLLQDPVILERVAGSLGAPLTAAALDDKVTAKAVDEVRKAGGH